MALTQESVLSFLLEHGGKVRNSELLAHFRGLIHCSDPAEKQHNRDLFKKLVNSVAVVRQLDDVKFVVVKKRYQDFVREGVQDAPQSDETCLSSFAFTSPSRPAQRLRSDVDNNGPGSRDGGIRQSEGPEDVSTVDTSVKVLNISGDQMNRGRKSGAVFAVISVKSPSRVPAPTSQDRPQHVQRPSEKPVSQSSANGLSTPSDLDSHTPAPTNDAKRLGKNRPTDDMLSFTQGRSQSKTTRQGEDTTEAVPLEPIAHEWLVKCAAGLWGHIHALLLQDTRLAQKKDFMSGFTALHWAAKAGNSEMIDRLVDVSRKTGTYIDVNSKAHGGYTPLHIAAIHGHVEVMCLLVLGYGASVNERDNDGKKACYYLGKGVSDEVRALVGGQQHSKDREKGEDGDCRELSRGFSTISKMFQPNVVKKQRQASRYVPEC